MEFVKSEPVLYANNSAYPIEVPKSDKYKSLQVIRNMVTTLKEEIAFYFPSRSRFQALKVFRLPSPYSLSARKKKRGVEELGGDPFPDSATPQDPHNFSIPT